MLREIGLGILGVLFSAYVIELIYTSFFHDRREPPRVRPLVPIPIIGHLIGFLWHGFEYYDVVSLANPDVEMWTLDVLGFKVYITHAPRLTHLIAKSKAISLRPFLRDAAKKHGVISEEAYVVFDGDLVEDFSERTKVAFAPGPHMDEQNLRMGHESVSEVSHLIDGGDFLLFDWVRHVIIQAMGASLFGMDHPFKDREMADAMWVWDEHRPSHIFGFDLTGKGYAARTKVIDTMSAYFKNMPKDVSLVIGERQRILLEGGISEDDAAKIQSTLSNAYFNTIPTLYWTIHDIFSRPVLLEAIREEIRTRAVTRSEDGSGEFILDIAALQSKCPLMLSAYQESQRIRHKQVAFRMVLEDTLIDGRLLKKGHHVHLPAQPIHKDPRIWGTDVDRFDPYRFVVPVGADGDVKSKVSPTNFMPWGAAPWLCPARQFATTEIMIIVALLAMRADLAPADGKGWQVDPPFERAAISTLPHPKKDVMLRIMPREACTGKWTVVIGRTKARISLASG